jgi:DNA-binding response OmpR family regulator
MPKGPMNRPDVVILICGHDPLLLETRRLILKHAGFSPITALGLKPATEIISVQEVDLLILCSSLSEAESGILLNELKVLGRSKVKTLALTKSELRSKTLAAKVLTSPVPPDTFQSIVGSLLETGCDCA